jgi:hypothetical protein
MKAQNIYFTQIFLSTKISVLSSMGYAIYIYIYIYIYIHIHTQRFECCFFLHIQGKGIGTYSMGSVE